MVQLTWIGLVIPDTSLLTWLPGSTEKEKDDWLGVNYMRATDTEDIGVECIVMI